jgi:hypothetical protein
VTVGAFLAHRVAHYRDSRPRFVRVRSAGC